MTTFDKIKQWALDRDFDTEATSQGQMLKLIEEVGELAAAIARKDALGQEELIADAIGDCSVVLTIIAMQHGLNIQGCIDGAYEEIKDRTGRMINGVYIKDAE